MQKMGLDEGDVRSEIVATPSPGPELPKKPARLHKNRASAAVQKEWGRSTHVRKMTKPARLLTKQHPKFIAVKPIILVEYALCLPQSSEIGCSTVASSALSFERRTSGKKRRKRTEKTHCKNERAAA